MAIRLIRRFTGLGTVQKVLLAGTAATAAAVIGTGAAYATAPPAAAHTATNAAVLKVAAAVDTPTAGDTTDKAGAADTDNIQSGDQTGPDTGGRDTTGADTDNVQSGDQTGPDTGDSAG
jgi:hypothetical protein